MGLLQTDLPDQVKIWFIFRALPPPLQRHVALAPDGSPMGYIQCFLIADDTDLHADSTVV